MRASLVRRLDPAADEPWEVWYRDTFDWECPPSVDARGQGLACGLAELWARFLMETVRPDGGCGFSRFHLRRGGQPSIAIEGDQTGAIRLRQWVFGDKRALHRGYVEEADALLARIAVAHASLVLAGRSCSEVLDAAARSLDCSDFERRLAELA